MKLLVCGGHVRDPRLMRITVETVLLRLSASQPIELVINSGEDHGTAADHALRWARARGIETKSYSRGHKRRVLMTLHNAHVIKAGGPDVVVVAFPSDQTALDDDLLKRADEAKLCLVLVEDVDRWRVRRWPFTAPGAPAPAPAVVERARDLMEVLNGAVDKETEAIAKQAKQAIQIMESPLILARRMPSA